MLIDILLPDHYNHLKKRRFSTIQSVKTQAAYALLFYVYKIIQIFLIIHHTYNKRSPFRMYLPYIGVQFFISMFNDIIRIYCFYNEFEKSRVLIIMISAHGKLRAIFL